jgi:serine protease Do
MRVQRSIGLVLGLAVALCGTPARGAGDAAAALAGGPDASSFAKLAESVKPAVINVSIERKAPSTSDPYHRGSRRGIGSGVVIDASGLALTNAHVVSGADEVDVTMLDGAAYRAKVLGVDTRTDLAVLRLEADGKTFPFLPLGDSHAVQVGDWVIAVGSPFGLQATVTSGAASWPVNFPAGPWTEARGKAKKWWAKLTDDELDRVAGKKDQLLGALQAKYGYTKEQAESEIDRRMSQAA